MLYHPPHFWLRTGIEPLHKDFAWVDLRVAQKLIAEFLEHVSQIAAWYASAPGTKRIRAMRELPVVPICRGSLLRIAK